MKLVHTKIVCTLGTDSNRDSLESIVKLIDAGMDVARINMSHSRHFLDEGEYIKGKTYKNDAARIENIRKASEKTGKPVAIMGDLMGQKIRIGYFANDEIELKAGSEFHFHGDINKKGDETGVYLDYFNPIVKAFSHGVLFLLSDGLIRMKGIRYDSSKNSILCEVLDHGILRSRQGVVLRKMTPNLPGFTKKDKEDLKFLLDMDVDFIAVSYIRSVQDIVKVRGLIETSYDGDTPPLIIAKIETEDAVDQILDIISESDGIMVARGDLGVRMDVEDVPILQKRIIHLCNILGKPVITATQMLESMISRPYPTRAEVSDVANAIFDGSDAVMLSGETAIGNYPIETVKIMRKVIEKAEEARVNELKSEMKMREWRKRIEAGIDEMKRDGHYPKDLNRAIADSITLAAAEIAEDLNLKIIMTPSTSGHTARLMSRFRTCIPIYAAVNKERIGRQLLLSCGVFPINVSGKDTVEEAFEEAHHALLDRKILKNSDLFLATSGFPPNVPGTTNLLKVVQA
jgi:pyruvate kinase